MFFRVLNVALDLIHRTLQRVRAGNAEVATGTGVGVQIHHRMLAQLRVVLLDPLGRAQQARLFAVPRAVDESAFGTPSLLHQLAQRARFFQHHHHARDRIVGAVHPGVVMVSANDPLVGNFVARDFRDDIIDGLQVPIRLDQQMHLRRARTDAVGDGQSAAPGVRSDRPADRRQQWLSVPVRERQHGNRRDRLGVLQREPFGILGCAHAGSQRVARILRIHDAAALHAAFRTIGAGGKILSFEIAILTRIGIDEASHRAMFGGELGLDTAPAPAIARDHDCALYRNAQPFELSVVVTHAVVDVDQRRGNVSIN